MNIDIKRLLSDHGVSFAEDGKHVQPGWIGVSPCPSCESVENHLGWNLARGYFSCWKCGKQPTKETLSALTKVPEHEMWVVMLRYKMRPGTSIEMLDQLETGDGRSFVRKEVCEIPGTPLSADVPGVSIHKRYLIKRGYDPHEIARTWGLTGTNFFGDYKFRVICPVWHDGCVVSFQGRDVTGQSDLRWKSCRQENEARDHKHCLGGIQLVRGDSVAVVEGFSDAWRLGPGAVCTFGTAYLLPQVELLRKFRRRFVVLDSREKDPNAAAQAEKLANMLSAFGGETVIVELDEGDPGDLPQGEADYLMEKEWRIR